MERDEVEEIQRQQSVCLSLLVETVAGEQSSLHDLPVEGESVTGHMIIILC